MFFVTKLVKCINVFHSFLGKAAVDPNAAWAAYYAQYYAQYNNGQQAGGAVPAQTAGGVPTVADQNQLAQTSGGQPDYTKAWEEYYKKMGMSKLEIIFKTGMSEQIINIPATKTKYF